MGNQNKLFEVADRQQGFFTAKQAEECGYKRPNFQVNLNSKEWIQEERGVYRLARYPITERPELVLWSLWSRNIKDMPQGVWSHKTALDILELCDVMPAKMHMTVPLKFRRRKELPKVLRLYKDILEDSDIEKRQGYKVTTPLRTIIDCITEGTVADNFILQAVQQTQYRGLITDKEFEILSQKRPDIYKKIKRALK